MVENILLLLLIWFIVSIPASLLIGAFLSMSNRERKNPEDLVQPETPRHLAHDNGKGVIKPSTD